MKYMLLFFLWFHISLFSKDQDFEFLMGKNTQHWRHLKLDEDMTVFNRFKALYEKNQHLRFHVSSNMKIPKTVHFIWLGPRPFPPESVQNIRTWIAKNPDWTFKFWTDRDRPVPCTGMKKFLIQDFEFQFLGDCFRDSENFGEQSDILRYEILYQEGGVYVDHDANCLQPFNGLHSAYDFYCGLEAPHPILAGRFLTCGNGVIGCRAEHPVVKRILELIGENWGSMAAQFRGKDLYSKQELVFRRTYIALTNALQNSLDCDGNVDIVLPAAYFFAKGGITPLYSKHFYANSWAQNESKKSVWEINTEKQLSKIKHHSRKLLYLATGILLLNLALYIMLKFIVPLTNRKILRNEK